MPADPQCRSGPQRGRDLGSVSGVGDAPSSAEEPGWSQSDENGSTQPPAFGPGPSPMYPEGHSQWIGVVPPLQPYVVLPLPVDSKRPECQRWWGWTGETRVWEDAASREKEGVGTRSLHLGPPPRLPRPCPRPQAGGVSRSSLASRRTPRPTLVQRPGVRDSAGVTRAKRRREGGRAEQAPGPRLRRGQLGGRSAGRQPWPRPGPAAPRFSRPAGRRRR